MTKIQSVKNHFRKHKVTYIACGVTAVVVAGVTYYFVGKPDIQAGARVKQLIAYKSPPTIEITNNIELTAPLPRGERGHLIECITTGEWFGSQRRAAEATGINRVDLSKHLKGRAADASGFVFKDHGEYLAPKVAA